MRDAVMMTRERFEQLVAIERTAGDFCQMMRDLGGSRLPYADRMVELIAAPTYAAVMVKQAFDEMESALCIEARVIG